MNNRAPAPGAAMGSHAEFALKIEQLRSSGRLPSPKGVALAIMESCRQPDATTDEIARAVQSDPALTGRLLRLANSAAGRGRSAASISDAVMRLGLNTVQQLAMGFSLVDQYQNGPCKAFNYTAYWSHSLLMAVAMRALGSVGRVKGGDELFACGLLARIGCLALATVHPVEYSALLEQCTDPAQLAAMERERLEADHNDFSAVILAGCGFPANLIEPACHHENPAAAGYSDGSRPYQLAHLFHHAMRLADMALAPQARRGGMVAELLLLGGRLGLDAGEHGKLVDAIVAEWREWATLLAVPVSALPPFATLAAAAPRIGEERAAYPQMRVLLVEDDPATRAMMEAVLGSIVGRKVHSAGNGREAMAMALETMPRIIITDWQMPVMDGIEFCRALRETEWGQSMYVIMLTGVETEENIVHAFEAGVDDYVTKPVNVRSLSARMRAALHYVQLLEAWEKDRAQLKQFASDLAISNRKLQHVALSDLLTGLPNRRAGLGALDQMWSAATRSGLELAVLMLDIDRFKSINDTHGHAIGDKVLSEVGKVIRGTMRNGDQACRLGGEEFLVICPNADRTAAWQAAERLRRAINNVCITVGAATLQVSASVGVACREADMPDAGALVSAADKALYGAKHAGRNQSLVHSGGKVHGGSH
ncbi:MAG: diguanylate cyclase [Sterolibacteriaceae bacterium]|nr:diguanylate cyclase [Sterolibacteriaceae bacterium]